MDEQQNVPPQQPPGYYPQPNYYAPPGYAPYAPPPQPVEPRLSFRNKVILGAGLCVLLIMGLYGSCHPAQPVTSAKSGVPQQPSVFPANPQAIEQERKSAELAYEQSQRAAQIAAQRAGQAPVVMPQNTGNPMANGNAGDADQQSPEKQLQAQLRIERMRRAAEAPFASGVGFVTPLPGRTSDSPVGDTGEGAPLAPRPVSAERPVSPPETDKPAESHQEGDPKDAPTAYAFNHAAGPFHRMMEDTILESTLLNRLDGEFSGPVITQISQDVYDQSGQNILIPKGSKAIGTAKEVSAQNQRRLSVVFHRIEMPDGYSLNLDNFQGLDQIGATGISGKVNNHYLQIFGASMVIGAVSGLAQIGNYGTTVGPMSSFRNGFSEQGSETTMRVLDRFLNRLPTIVIPPGTRVKLILATDLPGIPEYANHRMNPNL